MKKIILPLDELEVMEGELIMVRGGKTDKKETKVSGCGCGCGCKSGIDCGCNCRSTEVRVVGCRCASGAGCGCDCTVTAQSDDSKWKLV